MTAAITAITFGKTYKNCTELRKVHPNGVPIGHPAYRKELDRDNDGWACEKPGWNPPTTPPTATPTPTQTSVSPSPSVTVSPSKTTSASPSVTVSPSKSPTTRPTVSPAPTTTATTAVPVTGGGGSLPTTGPGEALAIGGGVILLGVIAVIAIRRRKVRFSA